MRDSLRLRLIVGLTLALLLTAVVAGGLSFWTALDEAHELQDDVLRQMAALAARQPRSLAGFGRDEPALDSDENRHFLVQRLDPPGTAARSSAPSRPALPATLPDGWQVLHTPQGSFRLLVERLPDGSRLAVAQELGFRDSLARDAAWRTVAPLLGLVILLPLVVVVLVRRLFAPVTRLAHELDQRPGTALAPIAVEGLPEEVRPFGVAINRLLGRATEAVAAQRRFVADAAHELRSPLTALSLQAESLDAGTMPAPTRARLETLRRGLERARHLLEQLLALARAQTVGGATPERAVGVHETCRRILEDLLPLALSRRLDVGVEGEELYLVVGELDLRTMLRNLLDNAIRYTPAGGRIDVRTARAEEGAIVEVCDTGPGIAIDERARVLAPFTRGLGHVEGGSGLGLSIVATIAERLDARLSLADAGAGRLGGGGLCARLTLPAKMVRGER